MLYRGARVYNDHVISRDGAIIFQIMQCGTVLACSYDWREGVVFGAAHTKTVGYSCLELVLMSCSAQYARFDYLLQRLAGNIYGALNGLELFGLLYRAYS